MKTAVLTIAALAAHLVAAQKREDYFPKCSLDCLSQGTKDASNCSDDDAWCLCIQSNYEAIFNAAQTCVLSACGVSVAVNEALPAAIPFCSEATSQHQKATQTPDEPASTAAAEPTSAAEEKPTSAAAEPTQAGQSSAAAPQSSAAGQSSAAVSKPTSAPAAASSAAAASDCDTIVVTPTKPSNGTVAKPTQSVVVVPTGAAAQIGSMGAAAMIALGALAAF